MHKSQFESQQGKVSFQMHQHSCFLGSHTMGWYESRLKEIESPGGYASTKIQKRVAVILRDYQLLEQILMWKYVKH